MPPGLSRRLETDNLRQLNLSRIVAIDARLIAFPASADLRKPASRSAREYFRWAWVNVARGEFGAPAFLSGGQLDFGQDRLDFFPEALAAA